MANFVREIEIFCCWLGGHAIIRRHTQTKWHLCRCGLKLVSDEELYYRYKAFEPEDPLVEIINNLAWGSPLSDPAKDIRDLAERAINQF